MEKISKLKIPLKKYKGESIVVSTRMPIELVKELDNVANETGRTRNEIVIMCLEFALNNIVIVKSKEEEDE